MSANEAALLKLWRASRDGEAFAELVARYSGLVYGVCRRITRDDVISEDLAQACFFSLARSRPVVRNSLGPWLHRVATNLAIDEVRARDRRTGRERSYMKDKVDAAEPSWNDIEPVVDEAVQELPERIRVPVILHFYEGRTQEAIDGLTGAPRSTVANRIKRGVEEVRKSLLRRGLEIPAATLTAFLTAELVSAAPVGVTMSLGKAALAGRLPGAGVGVPWTGVVVLAGALVAAIGLSVWLGRENPEDREPIVVDSVVVEIAAVPSGVIDDGALVEVEVNTVEAVEAPPRGEVQPALEAEPEPVPGPSVSGTVTDISGAPVPGAFIRLMPKENASSTGTVEDYLHRYGKAYADSDGNYSIFDVQLTGQVLITAVAQGFLVKEQHLTLASWDEREGIDFVLEECYDFVGRVLDARGAPVQGALVIPLDMKPRSESDLWRHWRLTDEDGLFFFGLQRLTDLEEGRYRSSDWKDKRFLLEVSAEGRGSELFYDVPFSLSNVVDFRLPLPAALSGAVTAANGTPLPNYTVMFSGVYREVVNPDGGVGRMFASPRLRTTDAEGRYEIRDLAPNMKYLVSLSDPNGERVDVDEAVSPILQPGSIVRYDLTANLGVILMGDVLGAESGKPVPIYARVYAIDADTGMVVSFDFVMDGETSYRLRLPKPGNYQVGALYGFFLENEEISAFFAQRNVNGAFRKVDVGAGENRQDVSVPEPFVLPFRVIDADGDPIESAEMRLGRMTPGYVSDRDGPTTPRRTDRDGRYTWFAMPGKELWVSATADGLSTARTPHFVGRPGEVLAEIELVLRKPGNILGRLVKPDGEPVASGGRVKVAVFTSQGQNILISSIGVGDDGIFHAPGTLVEDHVLVTIALNRRDVWPEPYIYEGPADVDLDFGDITVWTEP